MVGVMAVCGGGGDRIWKWGEESSALMCRGPDHWDRGLVGQCAGGPVCRCASAGESVGQWAGVRLSQWASGPMGKCESGEGHPGCWGARHREVSGLEQGHDQEPELELEPELEREPEPEEE
jgi:hypothetical protein